MLFGCDGSAFRTLQDVPTAEGVLLAAFEAAARQQEGCVVACAEVHSCASSLERGVHALANALHLRLDATFEQHGAQRAPPPVLREADWLRAVRRTLPPSLSVLRCFSLDDNREFDARTTLGSGIRRQNRFRRGKHELRIFHSSLSSYSHLK